MNFKSKFRKSIFAWLALLIVLWCPLASAAHYKLFVLTGQSNSLGTTNAGEADVTPGTDPADAQVKFFWSNWANGSTALGDSGGEFTALQSQQGGYYTGSASHWGPEINFGRKLYRAGVRDFGIIKCSRGGGGNSFWSKTAADHHMFDHVVNTVNAATASLTAAGDTFEIVGLLYLQGESDSPAEAEIAGTRLKELTDNLRADLPNAENLHCVIGGIARPAATSNIVRARHAAIAASTDYIDFFSNLDLQAETAADNLHFNKAAKLAIGGRFAQAFFKAGVVERHYGKLVFLGDSITQGGNGDHPSYRYQVFKHLATQGVPIDASSGYKFTGSQVGAYANSALTTPDVNGQVFENVHDGHYGWRTFWKNARLPLPAGRYNVNNLGNGTLLNWTGQATTYATANAGDLTYTGNTYTADTAVLMIGINDLGDNNNSANQVISDIGLLVDQLRTSNPEVRIHINHLLYTNQTQAMRNAVDAVNSQLPALASDKNANSTTSPVWIIDANTGFDPATLTYDNVHPNAAGEIFVGDRIAAGLGIIAAVEDSSAPSSGHFEGNEIWDGSQYVNGWNQVGGLTKSLSGQSDLTIVNPGGAATWIEGTNTGWSSQNQGEWTLETRLKFNANPNGFVLWLGVGSGRILVEIHGNRTQNSSGGTFNVAHNNLDGEFHTFRVTHDATSLRYHVWRDDVRLTPVNGVPYDSSSSDNRLILGDFTSGAFGNNFNATIDYVSYHTAPFAPKVTQNPREIPRFGEHEVLEIMVFAEATGVHTLESVTFDLREGSAGSVSAWKIHTGATFDPSSPVLAEIPGGSGEWSPSINLPLEQGSNKIYLSAVPMRYGEFGATIDAAVESLSMGGAEPEIIIPENNDPQGELTLGLVPLVTDVRKSGQFGIHTYRIPGIACDSEGVLHAVFDHRLTSSGDVPGDIDIGYSRSSDGGATWSGFQAILDFDSSVPDSRGNGVSDPCILHDPATDTLWVAALWSQGNNGYNGSGPGTSPEQTGQYVLTKSTDGGFTWSEPVNITEQVKEDPNWRLVFQGPGHGLVMRDGTLVFPSQRINAAGVVQSCSVFSSDHGETWDFGTAISTSSPQTNENTVCELDDGRLLFSMRTPSGSNGQRAWAHYTPGGAIPMRDGSWENLYRLPAVPDPVCQGSVIQWTSTHRGDPKEFILFGNPASSSSRSNFTLRLSADGGASWPVSRLLNPGFSGYSSLCILPDKSIGVLLERSNYGEIVFIRVEAEWLMNPDVDSDGDGMPDAWEILHGLDPNGNDAELDADGDGVSNFHEYLAGTNPQSASSVFRSTSFSAEENGWEFAWQAVPGKTYLIETSPDLENWQPWAQFRATTASMSVVIPAEEEITAEFFRAKVLR